MHFVFLWKETLQQYLSENLPFHFGSPEKKHLSLTTSTSLPSISGNFQIKIIEIDKTSCLMTQRTAYNANFLLSVIRKHNAANQLEISVGIAIVTVLQVLTISLCYRIFRENRDFHAKTGDMISPAVLDDFLGHS